MSTYESDGLERDWVDARLEAYVDGDLSPEEMRRLEARLAVDPEAAEQLRLAKMVRRELSAMETPLCPPEVVDAVVAEARRERAAEARPRRWAPFAAERVLAAVQRPMDAFRSSFLRPSLATAALAIIVVAAALIGRATRSPDDAPSPSTAAIVDSASTVDSVSRPAESGPVESGPVENEPTDGSRSLASAAAPQVERAPASDRAVEPGAEPPIDAPPAPDHPETFENPPSDDAFAPAEVRQALKEAKWALAFVSDVGRDAGQSIGRDVLRDHVTQPIRRALGAALTDEPTS